MLNLKANASARASQPVKVEGAIPLQLEKRPVEYALATDGPLSLVADFPAVFLAKLPTFISRGIFTRGILSGNLTLSGSVQHPLISGSANLVDGQLLRGSAISAGVSFKGRNAVIDFAHVKERDADVSARGEIEFEDISDVRLVLSPNVSLTPTMSLAAEDCVGDLSLFASPAVTRLSGSVNQIDVRGNLSGSGWTISLSQEKAPGSENNDAVISPRTFRLCRDGKTLSLGTTPALFP
jgi:autotransporter translocation and assembly factor TamB